MKTLKRLPEEIIPSTGAHARASRFTAVAAPTSRTTEVAFIYVVDDDEVLIEMYMGLLEATGHIVKAFNDRVEALVALKADRKKPDLLITDYVGLSIPVDRFMRHCRIVHPALRILMITGLSLTEAQFSEARPDRFIQKPFTVARLRREVGAVLAV